MTIREQYCEVESIRTHVTVAGKGDNYTLLLHGWGGNASTWECNLEELSKAMATVALDLPGFGLTGLPSSDWGVNDFADFTVKVMDALDIRSANLVGRSFGGRVAIKVAAHFPSRVRRLVLVDSAGLPMSDSPFYFLRWIMARIGKYVLSLRPFNRWYDEARELAYHHRVRPHSNSRHSVETFKLVVSEDLSPDLVRIQAPTLLVWGSNDRVVPLKYAYRMSHLVPKSSLHVIEAAGHQSHKDKPDEFNAVVSKFLGAE